jgi:hypothetical protein
MDGQQFPAPTALWQVRRAAAQHLAKFAAVVEPDFVSREFVSHFHQLTQDGAALSAVVIRGRGGGRFCCAESICYQTA